ncbi:alpha-hydroxy-acid oxidizing protein [Sarcina sp. JB2]|uniref:Alpha-hydroxy-acid oxidizing protein n=1 Tax=Candidatus Sarcina troglodytae TaxID=2726954 RepID=A0ACD1BEB6_9CLOT|nr:alpha-hydroxy-acid oxidizing protein [Sarcina sp. JB2]QPJ85796.1 alpha-hydroxy-acid oxidizing protein [Sarcina sp. JB2]
MKEEQIKKARELYNGTCRVCKVCNGVACAGEVPGVGGKGTGDSFKENVKALNDIKINMRVIHNAKNPNTETELFGKKMSVPIFAAPITATSLNMGGIVSEEEYITSVIEGCLDCGIYPMVGDTAIDECLVTNLEILKQHNGQGIVFIKPRKNNVIIEKINMSQKANVFAMGIDIDGAGLLTMALHGKDVEPKTVEELKELKASTNVPFILKGIMTVEDAKFAVEAGMDAIVVSNHGGRVLDQTPGTVEVLPKIAREVKGKIKILVDGGIRSGVDVLKCLALGADGVLIGRPFVTAAFANGKKGVKEYVDSLQNELKSAMILTGCNTISEIDEKVIYIK